MKKKAFHKHIHSRLLTQLVIFGVLAIIMIAIVGYDVFAGTLNLLLALGGFVLGILIGFAVGRMFAIKWHEATEKVIVGMDKTSILIIVIYVAFRILGDALFGQFLHGAALSAFTFSMLGGIMIGRFISMTRTIRTILKKQKFI